MRAMFLCVLLASSSAVAGMKPVDVSRPIEEGGAVRIDVAYGSIRVVAAESGKVSVSGEISEVLDRVTLGYGGGSLEVRVRFSLWSRIQSAWRGPSFYRAELLVEVPADTRLFIVSRDARVEIDGVRGPIGVGVVSSDVIVRGSPSRLSVETVSGSLDFEGRTPVLSASTMSGRLRAIGIDDDVRLEAVTGSLEAVGDQIRSATLSSFSGDVLFGGGIGSGGKLEIETESGNVTLECCGPVGVEVDLTTRDGEIINEVSDVEPIRDARGRRRLQLALEGGGGRAEVRTRSGLIRLVHAKGGDPGC